MDAARIENLFELILDGVGPNPQGSSHGVSVGTSGGKLKQFLLPCCQSKTPGERIKPRLRGACLDRDGQWRNSRSAGGIHPTGLEYGPLARPYVHTSRCRMVIHARLTRQQLGSDVEDLGRDALKGARASLKQSQPLLHRSRSSHHRHIRIQSQHSLLRQVRPRTSADG